MSFEPENNLLVSTSFAPENDFDRCMSSLEANDLLTCISLELENIFVISSVRIALVEANVLYSRMSFVPVNIFHKATSLLEEHTSCSLMSFADEKILFNPMSLEFVNDLFK
jgi:hypothetical protein